MEQKKSPKTIPHPHSGLKKFAWVVVLFIGAGCDSFNDLCEAGPPADLLTLPEIIAGSVSLFLLAVVAVGPCLLGAWWFRKNQIDAWNLADFSEAPGHLRNRGFMWLSVLAVLLLLGGSIFWLSDCPSWLPGSSWLLGGLVCLILGVIFYRRWAKRYQ